MKICLLARVELPATAVAAGEWRRRRLAPYRARIFFTSLLAAMANLANHRLVMAIVSATGRKHFFAFYSFLSNVTLGLASIACGMLIDDMGEHAPHWLSLV